MVQMLLYWPISGYQHEAPEHQIGKRCTQLAPVGQFQPAPANPGGHPNPSNPKAGAEVTLVDHK